jgi:hypothetical protein
MGTIYDGPETSPYRVWYMPQVPGQPFVYETGHLRDAQLVLDALTRFSWWEFEHKIKEGPGAGDVVAWGGERYEDVDTEAEAGS